MLCPIGKHNLETASESVDSCVLCEAGKYANQNGTTDCTLCAKGSFQSAPGQTGCKVCTEEYGDDTLTSTADRTGCEVNAAFSGSMLTMLFSDGVGLAGSFGISAGFLALAGMLHLKIAQEPHTLAQLSHTQAALKSFVPGFTFGSEFVLVIGLWSEARGLAVTILLFRLLHAVCAIALIAAIYAPFRIAERLDGVIEGASKLRDDLDRKFSRANTHLVVAMLLLIVCDVMMVPLMPWKQSRFNEASRGFPSMGVLQCCSGVKTLQSLVSAACQIAFLAGSSTLDDPSTGGQAKVIFGLSITGSVVSVIGRAHV